MRRLLRAIGRFVDAICIDTMPKIPPPPPRDADFRPLADKVADAVVDRLRREGAL